MTAEKFGSLAESVYRHKYAHVKGDGVKETWAEIAARVAFAVCPADLAPAVRDRIARRQVLPGGRYLYAAGRKYAQVANCGLLKAYDSRQGWAGLLSRATNMLMTGMGVGVVYSDVRERNARVGGMGGLASGPCSLMQMLNEVGRHIKQGGSRRSALWAGLHWHHPDVFDFVNLKNWPDWMRELKARDFDAAATMDGTNISVVLDDAFFHAYHSPSHRRHSHARQVYDLVVRQMVTTGEPGFSIDVGDHAGEHLRNAPVAAGTRVLTPFGFSRVGDLLDAPATVWTGRQWARTRFRRTAENAPTVTVRMSDGLAITCDPSHPFLVEDREETRRIPAGLLAPGVRLHVSPPAGYAASGVTVTAVEPSAPEDVYCCDVGVEEHSFQAEGVIISNCTEVVSRDDNDVCNLASLNLARFDRLDDFRHAVEEATAFLLHGTVYSQLPTRELLAVRDKNRRLGLGLMGMHEWLLKRGKRYGPDAELAEWLAAYRDVSDATARRVADALGVARPAGVRAVAPTGTIAIVAETTSGIEPVFATAFKRRYLKGDVWHAQYVIDSAAQRLVDQGVDPDAIEDAYALAADPARRLDFQTFAQGFVDQGISSTLNLPAWGSAANNPDTLAAFAGTLIDRLPLLRGVTAYPDGSRGGQPLTAVPYREAVSRQGVEFEEHGNEHACVSGVCGV